VDTQYVQAEPTQQVRRRFLEGLIYGLGSLIAGALSLPAAFYLLRRNTNEKSNGWVDAGELPRLQSNSPRKISFLRNRIDGWKIHAEKETAWIVKGPKEEVIALSPVCTHLGCAYQWESGHDRFLCPCHGSLFTRTGQVIAGPAPRPLDRYDVKLEGTRIWLGPLHKS
jgi:menaquinol-cytochrome c reductase iron-sulfur subunit